MNKIKIYSITFLIIAVAMLAILLNQSQKERKRLDSNQTALLTDVKTYMTKDSLNVASVQKLTLTVDEFKKYNSDLTETVKSLNIKIKRLQSVSQTATQTDYKIKLQIKDSLIYRYSKPDTLKCVDFTDTWLKIKGCADNGQFSGIIESKDTIVQVIHRVPRKFLFFKYGTKAVRQEVLSKNPHTKVVFTEYIELK